MKPLGRLSADPAWLCHPPLSLIAEQVSLSRLGGERRGGTAARAARQARLA